MKKAPKLTPTQVRLKQLTALDEKIRMALLGHPVHDRNKLQALQRRVHDEIRALNKQP